MGEKISNFDWIKRNAFRFRSFTFEIDSLDIKMVVGSVTLLLLRAFIHAGIVMMILTMSVWMFIPMRLSFWEAVEVVLNSQLLEAFVPDEPTRDELWPDVATSPPARNPAPAAANGDAQEEEKLS